MAQRDCNPGGVADRLVGLDCREGNSVNKLFSYGTLQLADVQVATFGRRLAGSADAVVGFRLDWLEIKDPQVLRVSGKTHHPIISRTGDARDRVDGVVLLVTDDELAQADAYEVSDYRRILAPLAGGGEAWVYVALDCNG